MKNRQQLPLLAPLEKESGRKLNKLDYLVLLVLIVVYSAMTFVNLGTTNFPTSVCQIETQTTEITLDFGSQVNIAKAWFNINICEGDLTLTADDGSTAVYTADNGNMFRWHTGTIGLTTRTLKLTASSADLVLNEIAFFDNEGLLLPVTEVGSNSGVVDEQDTIPESPSYFNGMYFDELYHARTAYENINNMYIFEWTHPPIGKLIISIGIRIFGMTPFGWRFMGALFGVLMLPILYLFAKRIFKRSDFALIVTGLLMFDCMHFTQTRIATIDTYGVFFIILMYFFMYEYMTMDHENTPFWRTLVPLGLCGLSFGLGISSKWIGFYAAAGLAVLLFSTWAWRLIDIIKGRGEDKFKWTRINWLAYLPIIVTVVMVLRSLASGPANYSEYLYNHITWYDKLMNWNTVYIFSASVVIAVVSGVIVHLKNRNASKYMQKLNQQIMVIPWCCILFVLIPAVIYFISFFPYFRYDALSNASYGFKDAVNTMWKKQYDMYRYHSELKATHSSSTIWYEWPVTTKSTWFYFSSGSNTVSNIATTGNVFVWWAGIVGFFCLLVESIVNDIKNSNLYLKIGSGMVMASFVVFLIAYTQSADGKVPGWLFAVMIGLTVLALAMTREVTIKMLAVAFIANYLPWVLVSRCVFIYHFFATVPFIILAGVYWIYLIETRNPKKEWYRWIKWIWLALAIIFFLLVFPAISGIPTSRGYANFIEHYLPGGILYHGNV